MASPINLSTYGLVYLSACPLVRLSTCPLVNLTTRPLVNLSTRQLVHLLTCPLRHSILIPNLQLHHALIKSTIEVGDVVKHTEDEGETAVVVVAHIVFLG